MSAPLTTRDALAAALGNVWRSGLPFCPDGGVDLAAFADALLASGALTDAGKLAEDEALVERVARGMTGRHLTIREAAHAALTALAAALSAQSECACGKPAEHVNADPDTAEWACRVPDFDRMTGRLSAQSERAEVER